MTLATYSLWNPENLTAGLYPTVAKVCFAGQSDSYAAEQCACAGDEDNQISNLIKRAQQGDNQAFEDLISRYLSFLSREIAKLCPVDSLHDVAQEVLIRVHRALPSYNEEGSFRWWFKKIISRACLDYWRNVRHRERTINAYVMTLDHDVMRCGGGNREALMDLERFYATLSADDRAIFTLAFLDDRPQREIAELLGISLAATKLRCFRLKQKARQWFIL